MMQVQRGSPSGNPGAVHGGRGQPARKVDLMSIELWRTRPATNPLSQVLDRLFEQSFAPFTAGGSADGGSTGYQSLPVNVWETEDAYYAALMAPGLDEQSINLTVHDDTLVIEGELGFNVPEGAKTVWQENCRSWFKDGKIKNRIYLWPGSVSLPATMFSP